MKFARTGVPNAEIPVLLIDGRAWDVTPITADIDPQFLASDYSSAERAHAEGRLTEVDVTAARWGSPITDPPAIICVGQNYAAHARESGAEPPARPIIFLKTSNTLAGPNDPVDIPRGADKVDWEVELGVVIGRPAYRLDSDEQALACVAGYLTLNDLSERGFQIDESGGQWSKGKCLPGFLPAGPWLATPDEVDPSDLRLRSWVNGEPRQDSTTADMIFDVATLVRDLSHYLRLDPGTIISTGTPEGVALSGRFPYLRPGDVCELEIDGLGRQRQEYVSEATAPVSEGATK